METLLGAVFARAESTLEDDSSPSDPSAATAETESLLDAVFSRVESTATENSKSSSSFASDGSPPSDSSAGTGSLPDAVFTRAVESTTTKNSDSSSPFPTDDTGSPPSNDGGRVNYLSNPTITPTALAHSLWNTVVRPYDDVVIDATCGNGKDAVALAHMLFPPCHTSSGTSDTSAPRLICIDVQSRASRNTVSSLRSVLPRELYDDCIEVRHESHTPLLPLHDGPQSASVVGRVGLACYNLGYLPSSSSDDDDGGPVITTWTETTIHSLTDATLLLRRGGLLSVLTYHSTCPHEAEVVRLFCEGLALFTTRG